MIALHTHPEVESSESLSVSPAPAPDPDVADRRARARRQVRTAIASQLDMFDGRLAEAKAVLEAGDVGQARVILLEVFRAELQLLWMHTAGRFAAPVQAIDVYLVKLRGAGAIDRSTFRKAIAIAAGRDQAGLAALLATACSLARTLRDIAVSGDQEQAVEVDQSEPWVASQWVAELLATPAKPRRRRRPHRLRIPAKIKRRVLRRDRFICQYCGCDMLANVEAFASATVDHVEPRAAGGATDDDNLAASCSCCNQLKGHAPAKSIDDGKRIIDARRKEMLEKLQAAKLRCPPRDELDLLADPRLQVHSVPSRVAVAGEDAVDGKAMIDQAVELLEAGRFTLAGMAAAAALLDHLRKLCIARGCLPTRKSAGVTWRRGFVPSEYAERLQDFGAISEDDACTVRRLEILGETVATLELLGGPPVETLVDDTRRFISEHPAGADEHAAKRLRARVYKEAARRQRLVGA